MEPQTKRFRKREAILSYLQHTDAHPSAETVYAGLKSTMPDISLGTVYRNLSLFKEQGMVQSLGSVKGVERFDGNVNPHVHFICTCCGAVKDLHEMHIPRELNSQAAVLSHAKIQACQLSFTGVCQECAEKEII